MESMNSKLALLESVGKDGGYVKVKDVEEIFGHPLF